MIRLREVAQQARFAAMLPQPVIRHPVAVDADFLAFESARDWAINARKLREAKAMGGYALTPARLEALARQCERKVCEIALQSEIILQRRADAAQADLAMLRAMMAEAA